MQTWEWLISHAPPFENINSMDDPLTRFDQFEDEIAHRSCEFGK